MLAGMMILDSMNAGQAIVMLLIAGKIPGTDIYIDATSMILILTALFGIVSSRITIRLMAVARTLSIKPVDA